MPRVSQIAANFATTNSFAPPVDTISVSPLTLARYALRNRDVTGFGQNDFTYLSYVGGFITEINKLNVKLSDFNIKNNRNLFVNQTVFFKDNVNLLGPTGVPQTISNIKALDGPGAFASSTFDNDALTVGDWRKYMFEPGMIMLWNGTFEELERDLPYWRLCAPPHAGRTFWGTAVPNLLGRFVAGSIPKPVGDDATPTVASNENGYRTDDVGGYDFVGLSVAEMHKHKHNVTMVADNPAPVITGQATFAYGGGGYTPTTNGVGANNNATLDCSYTDGKCSSSCNCPVCNGTTQRNCAIVTCFSYYVAGTEAQNVSLISGFSMKSYNTATVSITNNQKPRIDRQTETSKGGSQWHENRPKYYALAYIIYVGEPS
jgi:microcystin-dependent protein